MELKSHKQNIADKNFSDDQQLKIGIFDDLQKDCRHRPTDSDYCKDELIDISSRNQQMEMNIQNSNFVMEEHLNRALNRNKEELESKDISQNVNIYCNINIDTTGNHRSFKGKKGESIKHIMKMNISEELK